MRRTLGQILESFEREEHGDAPSDATVRRFWSRGPRVAKARPSTTGRPAQVIDLARWAQARTARRET